jgi:hypothetical protein
MTAAANMMFALPAPPPKSLSVGGTGYRLVRVFKHDFWAATCLYERDGVDCAGETDFARIVVKFGRQHSFAGIPLSWVGRWLTDHEQRIYEALAGLAGTPAWVGRISPTACAIEYIEAVPLDHLPPDAIPDDFFDRLREIFQAIHDRGVAYGDANKRSNILVADGRPILIDFQISLRADACDLWAMRRLWQRVVEYLQHKDLYHLYKHKRRLRPDLLTADEDALSRHRSGLHGLHRKLTKPYRSLRRRFLKSQHESGKLTSPTDHLEDHHQPEKRFWREQGDSHSDGV